MLDVFIIIDVPLQGAVGRQALPQKHRVHDGLPVDRVADGGDDVFIFAPVVVPEVKENAAVVAGFEIVAGKAVFSLELLGIFGVEERKVQLAGLQLHCLCVVVGDDFEDDTVDVCSALKIALVFLKNDRLTDVPACELICARADGAAEEIGGLEVFAIQKMLRQNRHRHVIQKCNVGSREAEGDGIVVFHRDFLHVLEVRRILRAVVGVHDGLNGELHVVCGEALAVVPGDI